MKNITTDAQRNLAKLVNLLKNRLQNNSAKLASKDRNNNTVYVDAEIYSNSILESFIHLSISEFNQTPYFSNFSVKDTKFVDCFAEILVEGATLYALSSQALIERGREFSIKDDGVYMQAPAIADMLNTQYSVLLVHHWEKLKVIKASIKEFNK